MHLIPSPLHSLSLKPPVNFETSNEVIVQTVMKEDNAECLKHYNSEIWLENKTKKNSIGSYLTGYLVAGFQMGKTAKNQSGLGMQVPPAIIPWL